MLALTDGVVLLRDFIETDIEDYVRWETTETEWKLWDAPWEHVGQTEEQRAASLKEDISWMRAHAQEVALLRDDAPRRRFEICAVDAEGRGPCLAEVREGARDARLETGEGRSALHIGGVSTYRIDDDFSIAGDGAHVALGIDINSMVARGHGYAPRALRLFMDYLFDQGERELYCQTWSGNVRMIKLAQKLGFVECCRKRGIREVRGENYDGLTFVFKR